MIKITITLIIITLIYINNYFIVLALNITHLYNNIGKLF